MEQVTATTIPPTMYGILTEWEFRELKGVLSEITKKIYSEISAGELFDKISILEIKKNKIKDRSKRNIVLKELGSLQETVNENVEKSKSLTKLYKKLKSVNLKLWKIEDDIRDCERKKNFQDKFIKR